MFRRAVFSFLLIFALPIANSFAATSKKDLQKLPPGYREWFERDAAYIITDDEKKAFLQLTTDTERDQFIDHFWEIRNPNPGSPTNTYKEEIYRRIAYANQWFGRSGRGDGWETDQGRVYITLGAPQQVSKYLGAANERPMEIWFYSNDHPALPPFFYVIFFKKQYGDEFKLYSPFMDGPDKLVTVANENDRVGAWQMIDHDLGREVSRTTLSLIPGEPVDMDNATSSMASDLLLNKIRGLANHPLNKERLAQKRRLLEAVSHRLILGSDYLDVLTVPLVGASGESNLHYAIRVKQASSFSVGEDKDHRHYYAATVTARVLTQEGKLLFNQERKLSQYIDEKDFVTVKNRVFGYEGSLPLPPGQYKIEFELADDLQHTAYRAERSVVVSGRPNNTMQITEVVPFSEATAGEAPYLPFSVAGVRFTPAMEGLSLAPGRDLQFFYQLWAPSKDATSQSDSTLQVEYAYGRMGMHDTQTLKEELARNQFDQHGALINGKKIPTASLAPGAYRMAITVVDPATHARSVASFQFRISDTDTSPSIWDVTDPQAYDDIQKGTRDFDRALCYLMQNDHERALPYLQTAYRKNPGELTRAKLVHVLYSQSAFTEISKLYLPANITPDTDEQTVLEVAESLNRIGQTTKSIEALETALHFHQTSVLYSSLARYYRSSGDMEKALEAERKAKSVAQPVGTAELSFSPSPPFSK